MADPPVLISNTGAVAAPNSYTLPPGLDIDIAGVTALFNGAGASTGFLPALAFYSQDGLLLARTFPDVPVSAGDSAVLTYAEGLGDNSALAEAEPDSTHYVSAASTNSTLVRAGPGKITGYFLGNSAATDAYVKLYDKATAPTVGTDVPKWTMRIPALSSANVGQMFPLAFTLGIGFGITTGVADSDTGAVGADEVSVNLNYL